MSWTDERIAQLKKLWAEGHSASVIAGMMGGGISRNAVIAKIDRERRKPGATVVPEKRSAVTSYRKRASSKAKPRAPVRPTKPTLADVLAKIPRLPIDVAAFEPPVEQQVTWDQLDVHHCRYPIGDPSSSTLRFCGGAKVQGLSYCEPHVRACYAAPVKINAKAVNLPAGRQIDRGAGIVAAHENLADGDATARDREDA